MGHEAERWGGDAAVLARILAGLRDDGPVDGIGVPEVAGVVALPIGPRARGTAASMARDDLRGGLPLPPPWATHSVVEDGGVTHERVSVRHPLAWLDRYSAGHGGTCPTDVSVSAVDRPGGLRWVRLPPTIQVEGGSYPLLEARRLARAIQTLIAVVT